MALLKNTRQAGLASVLHPMHKLQISSVKPEITLIVHLQAFKLEDSIEFLGFHVQNTISCISQC